MSEVSGEVNTRGTPEGNREEQRVSLQGAARTCGTAQPRVVHAGTT